MQYCRLKCRHWRLVLGTVSVGVSTSHNCPKSGENFDNKNVDNKNFDDNKRRTKIDHFKGKRKRQAVD